MKPIPSLKPVFVLILSLALSGAAIPARGPAAMPAAPAPEPALQVIRSDDSGIVLELTTPAFTVEQDPLEGGICDRLLVPGYATTDRAGWPELLVRGAMVGIPPGVALRLTVVKSEGEPVPRSYDLCPVPRAVAELSPSGGIEPRGQVWERDPAGYASDALYPASLAEIVSTGYIRSQRVAQLRLHPFRIHPATGQLYHVRRMVVRVDFDGPSDGLTAAVRGPEIDEGPFEETLRRMVLNDEAARGWRTRPEPVAPRAAALPADGPLYRVEVDRDGIYEITREDLAAAGADLGGLDGLDPRSFRLHNQGQEVAIHVVGEEDGSFDPGDEILFYGEGMDTRFTDVNVYWLSWGGADGARMSTLDGTPDGTAPVPESFRATHRMEEDHNYQASRPSGPDDDRWYWEFIWATSPTVGTYTTTLQHVASGSGSVTVRGLFKGFDAVPEHHTRVHLNGHLIDDATWAPRAEYQFAVDVPASHLIEGTNTITVEVPMELGISGSFFLVNWFEIDYDRAYTAEGELAFFEGDSAGTWEYRVGGFTTSMLQAFDLTVPANPARIVNPSIDPVGGGYTLAFQQTTSAEHRYVALSPERMLAPLSITEHSPSNLRSSARGADYIIITHGDFYTEVLPLAEHRAATGLRTAVVDVQDVYDEFSHGIFDPTAIRDFLAYTYAHWIPPAPSYVLLVGDGNYDLKDRFGRGEPTFIPPYLADVDPWFGETAADNRYVCVSGDDILPDMHIGRLPVKTGPEAAAMVTKILGYELNPDPGGWNDRLLFVADSGGDFAARSNDIVNGYLPEPYAAEKVYRGITHATVGAARQAIVDGINQGRLVVNYFGHSTIESWGPNLLRGTDIEALTNAGRLPLMVPMTCLDGYFIHPSGPGQDLSSLGERIVRAPRKGAIASWSPTGMGVSAGHSYLNRGLFQAIFFDGVQQVGPATTEAKLFLYGESGGFRDLIDTYVLFGDPALGLRLVEETYGVYLPVVMRGE